MAATATLTDDFTGTIIDAAKWTVGSAAATQNGTLTLSQPNTNYNYFSTSNRYNIIGSYAYVKVLQVPHVGLGSTEAHILELYYNDTNFLNFYWSGGFSCRVVTAGAGVHTVNPTGGIDIAATPYLRIREASNVIYWDKSANGTSWTNIDSFAFTPPYWTQNDCLIRFLSAHWNAGETDPGVVELDNYNTTGSTAAKALSETGSAATVFSVVKTAVNITATVVHGATLFSYSGPTVNAAVSAAVVITTVGGFTRVGGYLGGYLSGYVESVTAQASAGATATPTAIIGSVTFVAVHLPNVANVTDSAGITDTLAADVNRANVDAATAAGTVTVQCQLTGSDTGVGVDTLATTADVLTRPNVITTAATFAAQTTTADATATPNPVIGAATVRPTSVRQDWNIAAAIIGVAGGPLAVQVRRDTTIAISGRVSATATIPALSPAVGSTIAAATLSSPPTTLVAPTVRRDANPAASPITSASVVSTAAVTAIIVSNPAPAVITTATQIPSPSVSAGITAAAIHTTATVATSVATASSTATPIAISPPFGIRIPAATVSAAISATVEGTPITAAATISDTSINVGQTIAPDVITTAGTIAEPAPTADSEATPAAIIGAATVVPQTVSQDVDIPADPTQTSATVGAVELQTGVTLALDTVAATVSVVAADITTDQTVAGDVITVATTIVQPDEITYAAAITAEVIGLNTTVSVPNITTVPDHPPVLNPTRTRNTNPLSLLRVINGAGAVHVPVSTVYARLTN